MTFVLQIPETVLYAAGHKDVVIDEIDRYLRNHYGVWQPWRYLHRDFKRRCVYVEVL